MLLDQLAHIIFLQLKEQPLAVLPGFGGFVKDEEPARFDHLRNRVYPPRNTVFFNAQLSHNDGSLVALAAYENELTYNEADQWLTDAVSELRFRLKNGETVVLAGLGELKLSETGGVEFHATSSLEIQDEFFGLKPISLHPVEKDNVDKVRELVATDGPVATKVRTLPIKRIASYAAAAIAVGFMVWMPIQKGIIGNGNMLVQQLNPFAVTNKTAYQSRQFNEKWLAKGFEKQDVLADKFNHEYLKLQLTSTSANTIVVKTDAVPSEEVRLDEAPSKTSVIENASSFKVIAATFPSKNQAADHVAKMIKRGFSAEYAGQDAQGHLVAYGTYDSLEDATRVLNSVSLSNKEARIVSGN